MIFSIILIIGSGKKKLAHFVQNCREMDFDNVVPTASTKMATPTMAQAQMILTVVPIFVSHEEKPEKFNGLNFKRWQQNMLPYLTTLNFAKFLIEKAPKLKEDELDIQVTSAMNVWKHFDFLYMNYVINALTTKEPWESLDQKYKFVVGSFLYYKMVDSKTVVSKIQKLQVILHEIHVKGMMLSERERK